VATSVSDRPASTRGWRSADVGVTLAVVPAPDLDELVGRKVRDRLGEMNGRLEELVAEAIDRELDRLVSDEIARRVNGDQAVHDDRRDGAELSPAGDNSGEPPAMKTCIGCSEAKSLGEFEQGRNHCRACRRRQRHPRKQAADAADEEPSPAETPPRQLRAADPEAGGTRPRGAQVADRGDPVRAVRRQGRPDVAP
jgi:hypothetical protein